MIIFDYTIVTLTMSQEKGGKRTKKTTSVSLPLARVSTIMKSSPDAANLSSDAVLLTAKAAELFLAVMANTAFEESSSSETLDYNDISKMVESDERFAFLKDIIPPKITVRTYQAILKEVEAKESSLGRMVTPGNAVNGGGDHKNGNQEDGDVVELSD